MGRPVVVLDVNGWTWQRPEEMGIPALRSLAARFRCMEWLLPWNAAQRNLVASAALVDFAAGYMQNLRATDEAIPKWPPTRTLPGWIVLCGGHGVRR